jgi:hypothetical protein
VAEGLGVKRHRYRCGSSEADCLMIVQAMPYPASAAGGTAPTPPTATYEYDYTERPWTSWATWPSALYDANSDKTYVAWEAQAQFRHIKIAAYNHATGTWSTPVVLGVSLLQDDDHGMPALEILSDGRLVCFYGSHASNQEWSISGQSGGHPDITTWTKQTALSGLYTYPKPVNVDAGSGAGTLYLFLRKSAAVNASNSPLILKTATYTSGGSITFGADKEIINFNDAVPSGRVYASEVRLNSGNIEFCATRAEGDDSLRQHVYYFRYVVSTGAIENLGASVSTASGSQPITLTTANTSYREKTSSGSNITGGVSWCRDSNSYLHIFYGDDTTEPFDLKHDWHNGTAWQGETTVASIEDHGTGGFVEDWCLVPNGATVQAYYPINNNGAFTGRGGDDIGRKTWNGSWGAETLVLEGDEVTAVGIPQSVKNADGDFRVMFSQVSQDETMEHFAAMKRYFLGDSGYLEWAAPSDPDAFKNILVLNFGGSDAATSAIDESGWKNFHPVTFSGNAQLDNTVAPPWGTAWLKLDGTGDYVSIPQSRSSLPDGGDWQWSNGGHTLEVVFRPNELGRAQHIVSTRDSGGGWQFFQESTNVIRFTGFSGSTPVVVLEGTTTVTTGGPIYKIAVIRKSDGSWGLRVNGTEEDTAASASFGLGSGTLWVGRAGVNTNNMLNGWVKQIRFTKLAGRDLSVVPSADFPVS